MHTYVCIYACVNITTINQYIYYVCKYVGITVMYYNNCKYILMRAARDVII